MMMPLSTADEIMKRKPRLAAIEVSFIANNVRPGERWDPELRDPQKKVRLLYTRVLLPDLPTIPCVRCSRSSRHLSEYFCERG